MSHDDEVPTSDDSRSDETPIGLLEGLATTRTIRRYTDDPIPVGDLDTKSERMEADERGDGDSGGQVFAD